MTKIKVFQLNNIKATEYKEHKNFISIMSSEGKNKYACTDIIFHEDRTIKSLKSDLSKDEVKKLLNDMVDQFYEKYEVKYID
jgi:hypothetical protein